MYLKLSILFILLACQSVEPKAILIKRDLQSDAMSSSNEIKGDGFFMPRIEKRQRDDQRPPQQRIDSSGGRQSGVSGSSRGAGSAEHVAARGQGQYPRLQNQRQPPERGSPASGRRPEADAIGRQRVAGSPGRGAAGGQPEEQTRQRGVVASGDRGGRAYPRPQRQQEPGGRGSQTYGRGFGADRSHQAGDYSRPTRPAATGPSVAKKPDNNAKTPPTETKNSPPGTKNSPSPTKKPAPETKNITKEPKNPPTKTNGGDAAGNTTPWRDLPLSVLKTKDPEHYKQMTSSLCKGGVFCPH